MQTQLLIDAIVQQTTVFIASVATAGGVRAPLAHIANEVFLQLSEELQQRGVRKKVIADMFGMALRTYHRRVRELGQSRTDAGKTLWEVVLAFLREAEPVPLGMALERFRHDDPEVVTGILNDLTNSGLAYRSGKGAEAIYRLAPAADFALAEGNRQSDAVDQLVWLAAYREGPLSTEAIAAHCRLDTAACQAAVDRLLEQDRLRPAGAGEPVTYVADHFEVPLGTSHGWEAAVLDHFTAMVTAVTTKLTAGASRSRDADTTGGSTWSLDVFDGHPLEAEALGTLARVRQSMEELRARVDAYNTRHSIDAKQRMRVVFYMGQYVRLDDRAESEREASDELD